MEFIGNLPITTTSKITMRNLRRGVRTSHGDSHPLSWIPILLHSPRLQTSRRATIHQLRAVPIRSTRAKQATSTPPAWAFTLEHHCPFRLPKLVSMLDRPSRWTPSISRCSNRTISWTQIRSRPSSLMPRVLSSIKIQAMRRWMRPTDRQWATSAWTATSSTGSLVVCLCLSASSTVAWQRRRLNHLESELDLRTPYGPMARCSSWPCLESNNSARYELLD